MRNRVLIAIALTIIALAIIQVSIFSGFGSNNMESLVINFMTEIMGVMFTFYVVDSLLTKHEKKSKSEFLRNIIFNEYKQLLSQVSQMYISFVTKNPPRYTEELKSIKELTEYTVENLDKYVSSNFVRHDVKVLKPIMKDGFIDGYEEKLTYQEYNYKFKTLSKSQIDTFLLKYLTMLPDEVVQNLSNINNLLLGNMLVTPLDHGVVMDISHAEFSSDEMKKPLKLIGECLIGLYKIVD